MIKEFLESDLQEISVPMMAVSEYQKLLSELGYPKEDYESFGWESDFCLEVGNEADDRLQLRGSLYYGNFKLIKVDKGEEYFNGALNG